MYKILHVITSLRTGGAEKLMVGLLPKLRDLGNEVELLLFDGVDTPFRQQLEQSNIKIYATRIGESVYDPRNISYLRNIINNYQIIHTHNTSPQLFAALAKSLSPKARTLLVTTEHNTTNRRRDNFLFKPIDKWMYRQYATVICISEQAETNLRQYLNDNSSKICTIYNGIDLPNFSESSNQSLNRHDSHIVVTMVAAFRKQKDQATLIRAISLLPKSIHLQLVGDGEIELIENCKSLVRQLNISDRVSFLGMRTDVPEILNASDIVVLSSHYEGLSLSSLEGMASGKPFVASDVDGLHEIVNGYGVLFPHEDAQALAEIILKLSEDKNFAEQIAIKCQARARQFDINIMANHYNTIYQNLIRK